MITATFFNIPKIFIPLAALFGFAAMVLPLYLYPIAAFDPIEGGAFYESPSYRLLYVPYAAVFAACAIGLLSGKMRRLSSITLFMSFIASHVHFKLFFGEAVVFKPAFAAVFIALPAVIYLLGIVAAFRRPTGEV